MIALIGLGVVTFSVIGGFVMEGGPLLVLFQPVEWLIIGGAACGILFISTPRHHLRQILAGIRRAIGRAVSGRDDYFELLILQFEVFVNIKKHGFIALEHDISQPESSSIISKYPSFLRRRHAVRFFSDALRLLVDGGVPPHELDMLLERELETYYEEGSKPAGALAKLGDTLPGLGIIAAVLGIVIAMQGIDGPPEEMGHKVAVALIGTFLGVMLSYGFVQPLATNLEFQSQAEAKYLECIKAGIVSLAKGSPPTVAVEFARRVIYSHERPELEDVEGAFRGVAPR